MGVEAHRAAGAERIRCAVITVSDTRGENDDPSGDLITGRLEAVGHDVVGRLWVRDEPEEILAALKRFENVAAVLLTGGTGTTDRDRTWAVVQEYCDEPLPAFATLFTQLSYAQVGPAAMLSRACAGICRDPNRVVFALPGSKKACELALDELIIPEIGHLIGHLARH